MKKRFSRVAATVLICLFLLPLSLMLKLPARAAGDLPFFVSELSLAGGATFTPSTDARYHLALPAEKAVFTADDIEPVAAEGASDTILISLINRSGATKVRVEYQYVEHGPKSEFAQAAILPESEEQQTILLSAPHISLGASHFTLTFSGNTESGKEIVLCALYNTSAYREKEYDGVNNVSCRLDRETETIAVSGEVSFAAMVRYTGETLALFSILPSEEVYLSDKTPLAKMDLTAQFSFSVPAINAESVFSRYIVAIRTKAGESIPLSAPLYPAVSFETPAAFSAFKGLHTAASDAALSAGADFEIVDVYLDKLHGAQGSGILYVGEDAYYYFNEAYVSKLDFAVKNLCGAGTAVYLRFLISPDADDLSYTPYVDDASQIAYKSISVRDRWSLYALYAVTDFLTHRYAETENGRISGIILGRRLDSAAKYNYAEPSSLADYAQDLATTFLLVANTARQNIPDVRFVLPFSDRVSYPEDFTAGKTREYDTTFLLRSFLRALSSCTTAPPEFSVMLESESPPSLVAVNDGSTYGVDRLDVFMETVRALSSTYGCLQNKILFAFLPSADLSPDALLAAYTLQYLTLWFSEDVTAFICDLSPLSEEQQEAMKGALNYTVRKIDSNGGDTVVARALGAYGISSVSEWNAAHTGAELLRRRDYEFSLTENAYSSGVAPIGTYRLFDFETATGTLGWYAAENCHELSVLSGADERFLSAGMAPDSANAYSAVACNFPQRLDFSVAPYLRVKLKFESTVKVPFEVQLLMLGEGVSIFSDALVSGGESFELFLDLSSVRSDLSEISCMRILSRTLSGESSPYVLEIESVTVESDTRTSEELAALMTLQKNDEDGEEEEKRSRRELVTAILVTVLVVFASGAAATLVAVQQKSKKGRGEKDPFETKRRKQ